MLGLAFISAYVWRISHEGRRMTAASTALQQVLAREHRLSALMGWQLLLHINLAHRSVQLV